MNLKKLFLINRDFIMEPSRSWNKPEYRDLSVTWLKREYIIPMSMLCGIGALLGALLFSRIGDEYGPAHIFLSGLFSFLTIYAEVVLSARFLLYLGKRFGYEGSALQIKILTAFSLSPFFLGYLLSGLFPPMSFALSAGIYSIVLLYRGSRQQKLIPDRDLWAFVFLASLGMLVIFVLLSLLFNHVFQSFTTFGN